MLRLIREAPDRISSAVGQNPVGIDDMNSAATFTAMFGPTIDLARAEGTSAVIESALADPLFVTNNAAGPFARRIAADEAFRGELRAMSVDDYLRLVAGIAAGLWPDEPPYFTVSDEWLGTCPAPLLILPGSDEFHPTSIAERICEVAPRARCLDLGWGTKVQVAATSAEVRAFLQANAP